MPTKPPASAAPARRITFAQKHHTLSNLPNNIRFYILAWSILLSVGTAAYLRLQLSSDQLFYIRAEQIYGFISLGYLYIALAISPISKIFKKFEFVGYLQFARRAIGVSAFYFALLHSMIATWGQLGGAKGLELAPDKFKIAFSLGFSTLAILFAMAATSFDKVITFMTLPRWKWLHRLVYIGGIMVLAHVWMIGTHLSYGWVKKTIFISLVIFFAMDSYRMALVLAKKYRRLNNRHILALASLIIFGSMTAALWYAPKAVKSYHSERHTPASEESHRGEAHEGVK